MNEYNWVYQNSAQMHNWFNQSHDFIIAVSGGFKSERCQRSLTAPNILFSGPSPKKTGPQPKKKKLSRTTTYV